MHYEDTRERMAEMAFRPALLRPDPIDDPPTERPRLTGEQYRWLEKQGYNTTQIEDMITRNVVNDYLPLSVKTQYSPLEKARELKRETQKGKEDAPATRMVEVKNGYSVMNTVALKRALTKDSLPDAIDRLRGEMVETIREELNAPQVSLEAAVELVDRVVHINSNEYSSHTDIDTSGYHQNHPDNLNVFLSRVRHAGGEIISIMPSNRSDPEIDVMIVHYRAPLNTVISQ